MVIKCSNMEKTRVTSGIQKTRKNVQVALRAQQETQNIKGRPQEPFLAVLSFPEVVTSLRWGR